MWYLVEIPLDGFKSEAQLHTPLQRQFTKMADHFRLTVEQRARFVVLFAETNSRHAKDTSDFFTFIIPCIIVIL